jgi:hypothetical protein
MTSPFNSSMRLSLGSWYSFLEYCLPATGYRITVAESG